MSAATDQITPFNMAVVTEPVNNVAIENYDFEKFIALFNKIEINLADFWLVNIGLTITGEKRLVYLIIRAYSTKPFFGPHLVSIFVYNEQNVVEMSTIWVHSLTFLRKELFQFQDRLSFERSTYLAPFRDNQSLIRLKSIRGFIQIPFAALGDASMNAISIRRPRTRERINQLLNRNLQSLVTFLSRELEISMKESIIELSSYTYTYCEHLINNFS